MSLGLAIGAITFTGLGRSPSLKLAGPHVAARRSLFAGQHKLNAACGVRRCCWSPGSSASRGSTPSLFWSIALLAFALGFLLIIPIGGADMPVVVSMLNSYSGWAAAASASRCSNDLLIVDRRAGRARRARSSSYIMCKGDEPQLHQRDRWAASARRRRRAAAATAERAAPVKAGSRRGRGLPR
jgi:NAD(P) transhydrogenase subunit beta